MKDRFDELEELEEDAELEGIMKLLKQLPQSPVKIFDFVRYTAMLQTAAELRQILAEHDATGQADIEICNQFNLGSVTARLTDLTVDNIPQFVRMVSKADNFEIYPRTDGTIQLDLTFQSVLKSIT